MFFVFNKQKIYTYLLSVLTVIVLLFIGSTTINDEESIETSSSTNKLLPIYSVQTDKKDIALTINCAW